MSSIPPTPESEPTPGGGRGEALVLAVACVLPTLVTLAYFRGADAWPAAAQQGVYTVGKGLQFALPVLWVGLVCRERLGFVRWTTKGLGLGIASAAAVFAATWGLYTLALRDAAWFAPAAEAARAKVAGMGLDSPAAFAALGVFYAVCHSLLEEYYWRWFVFRRLRARWTLAPAVLVSAVAFAAHHVVVLDAYFPSQPLATALFAAAVAVGGAFWAWLYARSGSLLAPWVSHALVDAAIFLVGADLVFG